ncbi:MAG: 4-oxalomesaconate hydratase [Sphingopyxis macrogoltabida]|uniref:4-oxalomesaconate hydratase n=1 Tax=Sphingopyxis macrogoltabida TaxID=33050 RepID=A0A2W5MR38_SPHMC|nr:MAG: 4-oxalomesaconate hydratase [Sphingopyxis macrogoltabida]
MTLIIDCHGHYTTAPDAHDIWRRAQLGAATEGNAPPPYPVISDDEIRTSIEHNQLRLIEERGIDMTLFSPRASTMAPHLGTIGTSRSWAAHSNELIARVCDLFPHRFTGVCMLPQAPGAGLAEAISELERCIVELGFVGCNLNPDPGGGGFDHPPLTDRYWYPLYEKLCELDVPAMIHVSGSCNRAMHATGAYYIAADTIAFMQLLEGDLFSDFPALRFIIPHGGGAVPYHWGRYRGLADMLGKPSLGSHLMKNIYFDTCVYHQPGINLLGEVVDTSNILFGSEMIGAVRGIDSQTGRYFDDTRHYIENSSLTAGQKHDIFENNARRVFPRLNAKLAARHDARAMPNGLWVDGPSSSVR